MAGSLVSQALLHAVECEVGEGGHGTIRKRNSRHDMAAWTITKHVPMSGWKRGVTGYGSIAKRSLEADGLVPERRIFTMTGRWIWGLSGMFDMG